MATPTWNRLNTITKDMSMAGDLAALRDELLAKGLAEDVPAARAFWDEAEAMRRERGRCGEHDEAPGLQGRDSATSIRCSATRRRSWCSLRPCSDSSSPRPIRAWWPSISSAERTSYTAMADYAEHMRMVGFLRELYPKVRVSLHAGELAPGLVPPEGLCCHIRLAVEQAGPTASAMAWT